MNGVMMPGVSAGSNQVGASEMAYGEGPLAAQTRHCRRLRGRSLHNPICRPSLWCVADRRFVEFATSIPLVRICVGQRRLPDRQVSAIVDPSRHRRAEAAVPRASWKGFLGLSLVSCPIYLSPATTRTKSFRLHQVRQPKAAHSVPTEDASGTVIKKRCAS